MSDKPSIFIGVPTCRDWKPDFAYSMITLASDLSCMWCDKMLEGVFVGKQAASLLSISREILVESAITAKATHILFIDDDTLFSTKTVLSLLSRNLDYVACNMVRKTFPLTNTAFDSKGKSISSVGRTGIEEVFHVGLGMSLIKMDALKKIQAPRFEIKWLPELKTYQGEDMYLCDRLRANGVKLYIDHDASNCVSHIGDFNYETPKLEKREVA